MLGLLCAAIFINYEFLRSETLARRNAFIGRIVAPPVDSVYLKPVCGRNDAFFEWRRGGGAT